MSQGKPAAPVNKMGTMPENRLLLSMSIPMMISMLVQALYNVVDSVFVSWLSEDALNAVSLTFPIQNMMIAVSVGTCIGVNALLSRSLGARDQATANQAANTGIFLSMMSYLAFAVLGLLFSRAFFALQVGSQAVISYGHDYMFWICVLSFGLFGQMIFSRLLLSTGKTFLSMIIQLVGAGLNIILNPILIFGYFGFPALGVTGSALATVVGQVVGMVLAIYLHQKYNPEIQLSLSQMLRPGGEIVRKIYAVGVPSIIMQSISSVMVFSVNQVLLAFTETATAVFGIYFKIQGFFFMPVFGLNNGVVPIIAYNYGSRKPARIVKTTKLSIQYAVLMLTLGFLVFQLFPAQLLQIFKASEEMMAIGIPALRCISPSFLLAGLVIVATSVFQALGRGFLSMMISLVRQLLFLVPAAYLLSLTGNLNLVWLSFPIAEVAAAILAVMFLKKVYRQIIVPMQEETADSAGTGGQAPEPSASKTDST